MATHEVIELLGEPTTDRETEELDGQRIMTFKCEGATGVVAFRDDVALETTWLPNQGAADVDGGNDLVVAVELNRIASQGFEREVLVIRQRRTLYVDTTGRSESCWRAFCLSYWLFWRSKTSRLRFAST